ncbi:hypothetical protein D9M68_387690 [compost metagenome]
MSDASDAFLARDILPVKKRLAVEVDPWADDAPHLRGTGRSKTRRTRGSDVCAGTKTKILTSRSQGCSLRRAAARKSPAPEGPIHIASTPDDFDASERCSESVCKHPTRNR